jgi:hypothetical protein
MLDVLFEAGSGKQEVGRVYRPQMMALPENFAPLRLCVKQ